MRVAPVATRSRLACTSRGAGRRCSRSCPAARCVIRCVMGQGADPAVYKASPPGLKPNAEKAERFLKAETPPASWPHRGSLKLQANFSFKRPSRATDRSIMRLSSCRPSPGSEREPGSRGPASPPRLVWWSWHQTGGHPLARADALVQCRCSVAAVQGDARSRQQSGPPSRRRWRITVASRHLAAASAITLGWAGPFFGV